MNYGLEEKGGQDDFSMLVWQISIDKLQEESKKIGGSANSANRISKNPKEALCTMFLKELLHPKDWQSYNGEKFPLKKHHILELIGECSTILMA